jgi:hypothetical protein
VSLPKNRENCFIAIRDIYGPKGNVLSSIPCGVFTQFDECEDYCGAWEQEWREKMGEGCNVAFRPFINTFYG